MNITINNSDILDELDCALIIQRHLIRNRYQTNSRADIRKLEAINQQIAELTLWLQSNNIKKVA